MAPRKTAVPPAPWSRYNPQNTAGSLQVEEIINPAKSQADRITPFASVAGMAIAYPPTAETTTATPGLDPQNG